MIKEKNYYYSKCLYPRKVFNRYTKQSVLAPCGKCSACLSAKANANTIKVQCESYCHRYEFFVTLTYANEYLPTATLVPFHEHYDEPDSHGFHTRHFLKDGYFVVKDNTGEVIGEYFPNKYLDVDMLAKKCNITDSDSPYKKVPVLDKEDVQNFLKRLRKYLKQYTDERIRYFLCGEYGPIHYRPHYHLLLWCEEEESAAHILEAVSKCWRFGRTDVSQSFGKTSSYVAKYVNGSCNLPKVFRMAKSQPFSTHSQHLGSKVFTVTTETFEESNFDRTKSISIGTDGEHKTFDMWRSVKHSIFPKCQGFYEKSQQQRSYSYQIYDITREWAQTSVCYHQARSIASYLMEHGVHHWIPVYEKMLNYFYDSVAFECDEHQPFNYDKLVMNIYRQILTSKHFLLQICKGDKNLVPFMLRKIESYYSACDKRYLYDELKMQEDNDDFVPKFYFPNLWVNGETIWELMDDDNYRFYSHNVQERVAKSVKHKELNDLNLIFNYL